MECGCDTDLTLVQGDTLNTTFVLKWEDAPVESTAITSVKFTCKSLNLEKELAHYGTFDSGTFRLLISNTESEEFIPGEYTYDITVDFINTDIGVKTFLHNGSFEVLSKENEVS